MYFDFGSLGSSAGKCALYYENDEMIIKVPKNLVGITKDKFTVDFKFADNIPEEDNIMLFIDKGDVAPNNRFNYRYTFDASAKNMLRFTSLFTVAIVCAFVIAVTVIFVIKLKKSEMK